MLVIGGISSAVYLSGKSTITEISVLRDITDAQLSNPKAGEIIPLYDFETIKWNGGIFRFTNISNVSFNPSKEAKIGTANEWLSNEYDREKEVKNFDSDVSKILNDAGSDSIGKKHSSIYMPVAMELNRLSKSKASKRILIVYSDLMENSPEFSFYNAKTLVLLNSNYEVSRTKLNDLLPLQNLKGIDVYLLCQPSDVVGDSNFKTVSGFYKKVLEGKGATVTISANLL